VKILNEYAKYNYQVIAMGDNGETRQLMADETTKSLKVISTDHSDVHNKKAFSASGIFDNVANLTACNYAFLTPTVESGKIVHLKYIDVQCPASKVRMDIYEAPTNAPTGGADYQSYNHYRVGEVVASGMQAIKANVTFDGTGATMLNWMYIPKNIVEGEFVLSPNTWYVVIFSNQSGGAVDLSFYQYWTEE
jgi:hypothetical protein